MLEICKNIRRFRLYREMSQKELADRLYISHKTVSKWETGAGAPDISQLAPLARIFGVSIDELLQPEFADHEKQLAERDACAFPHIREYGVSAERPYATVRERT